MNDKGTDYEEILYSQLMGWIDRVIQNDTKLGGNIPFIKLVKNIAVAMSEYERAKFSL